MAAVVVTIPCTNSDQAHEMAEAVRRAGFLEYADTETGTTAHFTVGSVFVDP